MKKTLLAALGFFTLIAQGNAQEIITTNIPKFQPLQTLSFGSTVTPDFSTGSNFVLTLTGNATLANPINTTPGQYGVLEIIQDSTGGRSLAFGGNYLFVAGAPNTLTQGANAIDFFNYFVRDSSHIFILENNNFSSTPTGPCFNGPATFYNPWNNVQPTQCLYVATTGNNGNSGTATAPFLTVGKAISVATPGTAILIAAGTYTENDSIITSGTSTAPIWLVAQNGASVTLQPSDQTTSTIQFFSVGWWVFGSKSNGFNVVGPNNPAGNANPDQDAIKGGCNNCSQGVGNAIGVVNSNIALAGMTITVPSTGYFGVKISQINNISVFWNTFNGGGTANGNNGGGLDVTAGNGIDIEYNYFENVKGATGMQAKMGDQNPVVKYNIFNNTGSTCSGSCIAMIIGGFSGNPFYISGWCWSGGIPSCEQVGGAYVNNFVHDTWQTAIWFIGAVNTSVQSVFAFGNTGANDIVLQPGPDVVGSTSLCSTGESITGPIRQHNLFDQGPANTPACTDSWVESGRLTPTATTASAVTLNATVGTGSGTSTFTMTSGAANSYITNFNVTHPDVLKLLSYGFVSQQEVLNLGVQVGPAVMFPLPDGHAVMLEGVTLSGMTTANIAIQ